MAKKHMKRCSTSLTREIEIRTVMRCHLAPIRTTIIKCPQNTGCTGKGAFLHCCWEGGPCGEQYAGSLKAKNRVTVWSNTPTLGPGSGENYNWKRDRHPSVHHSTIYNRQNMKATDMSIIRGIGREPGVHICNRVLSGH